MFSSCSLCPRSCGANRVIGNTGRCGASVLLKAFRWGPHHGEEPPISGTRGSGAVFFSHCQLGCVYCQNHPWSAGGAGRVIGVEGLARIFCELRDAGCHNWNLVTPEPWLPHIATAAEIAAARLATRGEKPLPFVYNTSGYCSVEVARKYRDLMDIVLTDLRYSRAESAYSGSGAADYPVRAREFAKWAAENAGELVCDGDGIARRGLIIRILVLPGKAREAVENLEWIAENIGAETAIGVMSQYTPVHKALESEEWNRFVSEDEYATVTDAVERLGFENGWVQDFGAANSPDDSLLGANMNEGEGSV